MLTQSMPQGVAPWVVFGALIDELESHPGSREALAACLSTLRFNQTLLEPDDFCMGLTHEIQTALWRYQTGEIVDHPFFHSRIQEAILRLGDYLLCPTTDTGQALLGMWVRLQDQLGSRAPGSSVGRGGVLEGKWDEMHLSTSRLACFEQERAPIFLIQLKPTPGRVCALALSHVGQVLATTSCDDVALLLFTGVAFRADLEACFSGVSVTRYDLLSSGD